MSENPPYLYRAYDDECFAKQFVESGLIRLGLMASYKEIEDQCRQDAKEGRSSWYVPTADHGVTAQGSKRPRVCGFQLNPLYLLCTAGPDVDLVYLRNKYGKRIVRINEPFSFQKDLCDAVPIKTNMELCGQSTLEQVSYTKDEDLTVDPDSIEAYKLPYTQKPRSFQHDREYRYIVTTKPTVGGNPDLFLHYDLKKPITYTEQL